MSAATDGRLGKGLPVPTNGISVEENLGTGLGILAGGVAGAMAGPIGVLVGGAIGAFVGDAAGAALHKFDTAFESSTLPVVDRAAVAKAHRSEHEQLDQVAEGVMKAMLAGDRSDVASAIARVQARVLAHIEEEEREILPIYAREAPEEAATIVAEHAEIRTALADLDVATDLHLIRANRVGAFLAKLRAHAAREDAGLCRWSEGS